MNTESNKYGLPLLRPACSRSRSSKAMSRGICWVGLSRVLVERDCQMRKLRVLLADDHPSVLRMVENTLEPMFEVVGKVADGKSLLEAAGKLDPDLIVTDISMPILNGIEAIKNLKESGSRAKVVFLTVHADLEFEKACFEAGASGYVLKPQMDTDLLSAIRAALA
jgi:DNA-binding NarL/FixJ family response regulator